MKNKENKKKIIFEIKFKDGKLLNKLLLNTEKIVSPDIIFEVRNDGVYTSQMDSSHSCAISMFFPSSGFEKYTCNEVKKIAIPAKDTCQKISKYFEGYKVKMICYKDDDNKLYFKYGRYESCIQINDTEDEESVAMEDCFFGYKIENKEIDEIKKRIVNYERICFDINKNLKVTLCDDNITSQTICKIKSEFYIEDEHGYYIVDENDIKVNRKKVMISVKTEEKKIEKEMKIVKKQYNAKLFALFLNFAMLTPHVYISFDNGPVVLKTDFIVDDKIVANVFLGLAPKLDDDEEEEEEKNKKTKKE